MLEIRYSEHAEQGIRSLSIVGLELHGSEAVHLYLQLIRHTVTSLSANPNQIGVKEGPLELKMFHLRYLRREVILDKKFVKDPSRFLVFRIEKNNVFEVVRVIREEMDVPRLLSDASDFS